MPTYFGAHYQLLPTGALAAQDTREPGTTRTLWETRNSTTDSSDLRKQPGHKVTHQNQGLKPKARTQTKAQEPSQSQGPKPSVIRPEHRATQSAVVQREEVPTGDLYGMPLQKPTQKMGLYHLSHLLSALRPPAHLSASISIAPGASAPTHNIHK